MHDFGNIILNGLKGVIKERSFYKKASEKERTITIKSGPGSTCTLKGRKTSVVYADGANEQIHSYDIEYVIKDGKKIYHLDLEVQDEVSSPATSADYTGASPKTKEAPKKVRRKR
jgi:hypothetical protein